MADAGVKVVDCIRTLYESESNLVLESLRGGADFTEWDHYPPSDVYDPVSHAQYYFHAHPPDDRDAPDYGHFHTFMRPNGMSVGVRPVQTTVAAPSLNENGALAHLIAISMTPDGMPERLFTTNRWVTGETWYRADDVIAMLDHFAFDLAVPSPALNQWLTSMLVLFRPQIERLLIERDVAIENWRARHPDTDVFEDRRLEVTSSLNISLFDQIAWLDRALETRPELHSAP